MKIIVRSFAGFRNILGKELHLDLPEGARLEDLLGILSSKHTLLGPLLFDEKGLREDVNIFVSGKNIASLESLSTVLSHEDEVALFTAAIGG